MSDPKVSEKAQARARWRQAQLALSKHELKSDMALGLDLLNRARTFPAWRGVAALAASWVLPNFPELVGEHQDPAIVALFVGLGAISLGLGLWWFIVDGRQWLRWGQARRDLSRGRYGSRRLAISLGLPPNASLAPVGLDSQEWQTLGEWSRSDRQLRATWENWGKKNAPVRRSDMRVLEEAVMALARLRDLNKGSKQELGKTPVKEPEQDALEP